MIRGSRVQLDTTLSRYIKDLVLGGFAWVIYTNK